LEECLAATTLADENLRVKEAGPLLISANGEPVI